MNGTIISAIIKNNIPDEHLGILMHHEFGIRPSFTKRNNRVIFQAAIKFHITDSKTKKRLFDFITATDFGIDKTPNDEGFYELTHAFTLTAIGDFNGYIKGLKSILTRNVTYPNNISFEKNIEAVRKAWTFYQFGVSRSNN